MIIATKITWDKESANLPTDVEKRTLKEVKDEIKEIEKENNCHAKSYDLLKSVYCTIECRCTYDASDFVPYDMTEEEAEEYLIGRENALYMDSEFEYIEESDVLIKGTVSFDEDEED